MRSAAFKRRVACRLRCGITIADGHVVAAPGGQLAGSARSAMRGVALEPGARSSRRLREAAPSSPPSDSARCRRMLHVPPVHSDGKFHASDLRVVAAPGPQRVERTSIGVARRALAVSVRMRDAAVIERVLRAPATTASYDALLAMPVKPWSRHAPRHRHAESRSSPAVRIGSMFGSTGSMYGGMKMRSAFEPCWWMSLTICGSHGV